LAESELIYQQILGRQNVEIIIVGHTDTAASSSYNNALSLRRAEKVKQNLINAGVPAEIIQTQGMGETNLLVPTADNTPEPENRRVEISVR
jgi:OOP family OmpA-OmpF porin